MAELEKAEYVQNAGAAFFGFMGVSLALVLASNAQTTQTSAQPTGPQRQALASAASPSGDLES